MELPLLVCLLSLIQNVCGSGTIYLKLLEYRNPTGQGANGQCCDGRWNACQENGCDYVFDICLSDEQSVISSDMSECAYGSYQTGDFENQDSIVFSEDIQGVTNPLTFKFEGETPGFSVKVKVSDNDGWVTASDDVDMLKMNIQPVLQEEIITLDFRTKLEVLVSVECSPDYYGAVCVYCAPSEKYTCTQDGDKLCNEDWTGPNCETKKRTATTTVAPMPVYEDRESFDCETRARYWESYGLPFDDVWSISPREGHPFALTFCDMDQSGNGWTLIQRNVNGESSFDQTWSEYKQGFGNANINRNYWMGLDTIYYLTNARNYKLKIVMEIGTFEKREAVYNSFRIGNEASGYQLHVDGYSGNAGDAFSRRIIGDRPQNGQKFTTKDQDNDNFPQGNCAQRYHSGWWYSNCYQNNLNGEFIPMTDKWPECKDHRCISWKTIPGYEKYSLLAASMWILPSNLS